MSNHDDQNFFSKQRTFGVCIRDNELTVLYQNDLSQLVCGKKTGDSCAKCQAVDKDKVGLSMLKNYPLFDEFADLVILNESDQSTVLFYPKKKEIEQLLQGLAGISFTKKEFEIIQSLILAKKNTDILDDLVISKSTLKTHLNHIYKKAPFLKDYRSQQQV